MNVIEKTYKWSGSLTKRTATKYIILHHRAGNGDVASIHNAHLKNDWSGIGYHFYVRKDGSVYRGRPINTVGAHCENYNWLSIGICFEGNFENEKMSEAQIKAGQELIAYLKQQYPLIEVKRHKDFDSTACPGKNFLFDSIKNGVVKQYLTTANDMIWELSQYIEISEVDKAVQMLEKARKENNSLYWILYKLLNLCKIEKR